MEFTFSARCDVTMNHQKGDKDSTHSKTDLNLEVSPNLAHDSYFNPNGLPNEAGVKALTVTLIQGLVGNIHYAKEKGYWDDVQHLKYVIDKLGEGFATVATVTESTFKG